MSAVIEIQTTEGKRLEWVAIYHDTDTLRAIEWGDTLLSGFRRDQPKPYLRLLDRPFGTVIGAWQEEGYEEAADGR